MRPYKQRHFAFGGDVLRLCEQAGLTQQGLGQLLGVSARAVLNWESGASYPDTLHLKDLIRTYFRLGVFAAGSERSAITDLWALAQSHAPRRIAALDPQWLQGLVPRSTHLTTEASGLPPPSHYEGYGAALKQPHAPWDVALPTATLVGREQELATLEGWLGHQACRLITLVGLGGVGKTALTLALARRVAPEFALIC